MCLSDKPPGNREGGQESPSQETGHFGVQPAPLRHTMGRRAPEGLKMRIVLAILGTLISTAAFAHGGHGETEAMHHGLFSPLNGFEPLAAVAVFAVVAWVLVKRRS